MNNWDVQATWHYHNGTKHPDGALLDPDHQYDRSMRPLLFKVYPSVEPIPLPLDRSPLGLPALVAIGSDILPEVGTAVPDLSALARLFYFSAGITKYLTLPPPVGRLPFRAAATTGALYHIELYLVCGDLPGLQAGVYHMDAQALALRRLREGDYRQFVVEASGDEPSVARAPAILVATDVVWRNACKYEAREYRHAFWDSGTMLANTLVVAAAHTLPAKVVLGFVDDEVSRLLDLDPLRELALALVPIGNVPEPTVPPAPAVVPLGLPTVRISEHERDMPAIRAMHEASSLLTPSDVRAWRPAALRRHPPQPVASVVPLDTAEAGELPPDAVESVIERRGSTRQFSRQSITFRQLSTTLDRALLGVPADYINPTGELLGDIYLIVNAVEGLAAGAYFLRREERVLELLKAGDFRVTAGHLALDQDLAADASVNIYFLADLHPILQRFGNRGYRAAQLDASIAAGKMYLAAYAQGYGATGLTFFDDEVVDFFSPYVAGKSVMFLLALGRKAKRT